MLTFVFENASQVAECNRELWVHVRGFDEAHLRLIAVVPDTVDMTQVHKPASVVLIQLQCPGVVLGRLF